MAFSDMLFTESWQIPTVYVVPGIRNGRVAAGIPPIRVLMLNVGLQDLGKHGLKGGLDMTCYVSPRSLGGKASLAEEYSQTLYAC